MAIRPPGHRDDKIRIDVNMTPTSKKEIDEIDKSLAIKMNYMNVCAKNLDLLNVRESEIRHKLYFE